MGSRGSSRRFAVLFFAALCALLASAVAAQAATRTVNETADNGSDVCANPGDPCSLRGAVEGANADDVVVVPAGTYTLSADENIEIRQNITIQGDSARNTIVNGDGNQRVFDSQVPDA